LLLAQILAENLGDLSEAESTIYRFIAQPGHAPKNIAFALYSLADWHLKFARDREAACRSFQKIIELMPGTEQALGAAQRIAHLGETSNLRDSREVRTFPLPQGVKNLGLQRSPALGQVEVDPGRLAADYVKHLEQHPLDTEAREKLAVIYVTHYKRLDLAVSELEQIIGQPAQPARLVVHCLNLMADLQIASGADYETVRSTLQRIIDRVPNFAAAELARKRLALLKLELKANQNTEAVKLGVYEQNIGLKQRV
jgi:tetratricopeptide (TPR) repeat protein